MEQELIDAAQGMSVHKSGETSTGHIISEPTTTTGSCEFVSANEATCCYNNIEDSLDAASSSATTPSSSEYFSIRIQNMMEGSCDLEAEIAGTKDHWTALEPMNDREDMTEANLHVFRRLQQEYNEANSWVSTGARHFFKDWDDNKMRLGRKIAEGGQAEIFEVEGDLDDQIDRRRGITLNEEGAFLLKVFKEGTSLQELRKQWPLERIIGLLTGVRAYKEENIRYYTGAIYGGMLLKNGRFAFIVRKCWGDLRKLIDVKMQHNHNRAPPFTSAVAGRCMYMIANGMRMLHQYKALHRDLKASNVLIQGYEYDAPRWSPMKNQEEFDPIHGVNFYCKVSDYESSGGIVGTGFWRAPEILLGLQSRDLKPSLFTEKSDVYSYAMTCYEILTGCIPLEGFRLNDYDVVIIQGERPKLPATIKPWLKKMLIRCWEQHPSARPTFWEIENTLRNFSR